MLGKWWQPPSKELLAAGHEKHSQREWEGSVGSALLSKRQKCPRPVHSASTASGLARVGETERREGQRHVGLHWQCLESVPIVIVPFKPVLSDPLIHFTDEETEARRHLIISPGVRRNPVRLDFLLYGAGSFIQQLYNPVIFKYAGWTLETERPTFKFRVCFPLAFLFHLSLSFLMC